FEPHMPAVDVLSDMDVVFAKAREQTAARSTGGGHQEEVRQVVVVTPSRMLIAVPMPTPFPGTTPKDAAKHAKSVLRSDYPLTISVVAYTRLEALMQDRLNPIRSMSNCIPFLGYLISFAYAGHTVVVFEGHRSAFEAGVRNSDVLIIDSAMLPF